MNAHHTLVALVVSFLWGLQPAVYKTLLQQVSYQTIMLFSGVTNVLCVAILCWIESQQVTRDLRQVTPFHMVVMILLPVFTMFLANVLYFRVLKDHETSIVSAVIYSAPVFTLIIAYLFLNERLRWQGLVGIAAIVGGVILCLTK
jgi:hypothetical protein